MRLSGTGNNEAGSGGSKGEGKGADLYLGIGDGFIFSEYLPVPGVAVCGSRPTPR